MQSRTKTGPILFGRTATDLTLKMGSTVFKDPSFFLRDNYDESVKRDLGGRKMTANDRFIQRLFPSSKILCGNAMQQQEVYTWEGLCQKIEAKGLYDTKANRWAKCPKLSLWRSNDPEGPLEEQMANFLNSIVDECLPLLGIDKARRWTARYNASSLLGHDAKRKPDLVLLDDPKIGDWRCVRSFGEMKSSSSHPMKSDIFNQITSKTAIIFSSQDNREYVLSLGFLQEVMELHRIDRSGCISSFSVQINDSCASHWKLFLRTILSLAVGHEQVIGYDTSIKTLPLKQGALRMMTLQYLPLLRRPLPVPSYLEILSTIFIGDGLIGRGTCVFRVRDQMNKPFIIKDTWHDARRCFTEGQILQFIEGIPCVPVYVEEVIVSSYARSRSLPSRMIAIDEAKGGMENLVDALTDGKFDDRIHLRLQMKGSKTKLITEFKNRKELANALLCCVKAHKQAYEDRGVLHRDIHIGNIFIDEGDDDHDISPEAKGEAENEGSKGMLGDWGYAQCFDFPRDRRIKKPTALPRSHFSHHLDAPEYSDSDDDAWMNCRPKASEEPAGSLRTSQRNSKNKKKARPKSPTPSDSQMSDATGTGSKPRPDELYEIFNPWYLEAPKELLDRTGAASFTALEIMFHNASPKRQHLPCHDLESFFYVILIITMLFTKPGEKRGPEYWKRAQDSEFLGTWWNPKNWIDSAEWKYNTMKVGDVRWIKIVRHISPGYFACWMPHIDELRNAIFGGVHLDPIGGNEEPMTYEYSNSSPIGYDKMISVLEEMVKVGEEEDRKEGHSQPSSPRNDCGEWKDYFPLENSDGSQTCDRETTEFVFTKVETFRIMNAIERSVFQLPGDAAAAKSDVPADQYPADPYVGNQPTVGNIPKFDNSSIGTSDLPTESRSTLSSSAMPSPSVMTPSDETHSTKRKGLAQPGNEPEFKKPRQNQPPSSSLVKSSRKDTSSTSKSQKLKNTPRTSVKNRQPARRASAGTSNVARTRASSSRQGRRKSEYDDEWLPSAAEEKRVDADKAVKIMKSLSLED